MQNIDHLEYEDFENRDMGTTLSDDTELEGELTYNTFLKIKGKFKGKINTSGYLWVDKSAEVIADVDAKFVKLGGIIRGNLNVVDKLEVLEGAKLFGNVKASRLIISDNTVFEGKCEMVRDEAI